MRSNLVVQSWQLTLSTCVTCRILAVTAACSEEKSRLSQLCKSVSSVTVMSEIFLCNARRQEQDSN